MKSTLILIFLAVSSPFAQSNPADSQLNDVYTINPHQPLDDFDPIPRCKINEKYNTCGTACEPSCDIPNPTGCTKNCVRGCQCLPGYYRNKNKTCVKLADCPKKDLQCKPNESYKKCGTACEPSCDRPKPGICPDHCVVGCQCNTGFYRNKQGNCVRLSDCPAAPQCKANQTYQTCGTACEVSCNNPLHVPCISLCVVGCQCNSGYYRNQNKDCVKLSDCPPKASNPTSCQAKKCKPPQICALVTPFCPRGHCSPQPTCVNSNPCTRTKCAAGQQCVLRQGVCIEAPCGPVAACIPYSVPPTPMFDPACPINEEYKLCKNACSEKKCGQNLPIACPLVCTGNSGCACKIGYYRNSAGKCVTLSQCGRTMG